MHQGSDGDPVSGYQEADLPGLLEGVRVLDLTEGIAGPYCTRLFSTMGAETIKVEGLPAGDPSRTMGPFPGADRNPEASATYLYLNCSKKGVAVDMGSEEGRRVVRELAASSQVVVESFAPGVLSSMGLGYQALSQDSPSLVMTSITGFGQTGPCRDWLSTELTLYAFGGLMNITGEPDQEPLKEGAPLVQMGAGQNAFVATMAALTYAEDTGLGQHVDVSVTEYASNVLENALMQYSYSGQQFQRVGNRGYGRAAWGIYPCRDGHVGIVAGPDHRWPAVAEIMERPELSDQRFVTRRGRMDHADEVDALMLPWLLDHDKVDVFKRGQERGLGFAYVASMDDILNMDQLRERGYFVDVDHPVAGRHAYPGGPVSPSEAEWVFDRAPLLGEHTRAVLSEVLGYSDARLAALEKAGVI